MDTLKKQQLLSTFNMPCHVCKEPSKSQCPSCRTPYCSKTCQRIDWKRGHKTECKELTLEFQRGYDYMESTAKKEAPPVVVIPDSVKPNLEMKHTTNEVPKSAEEEEAPSAGESCPICLELLPKDPQQKTCQACCGNKICTQCWEKCAKVKLTCPLCRMPIPTNEAEVVAQIQNRVTKGDKVAQWGLGSSYEHGLYGLKKSMKRAAQLYELSAAQGHTGAQCNLGACFKNGHGVKLDNKKALKYYTMAAEKGIAEAQCICGFMYMTGEGVERDSVEVQKFWELAAAQGHQVAQQNLAVLRGQNARR